MNLAQFSIEKNRISLTILATIVILGIILYPSLPRDSMPPYTVRVATIVTPFPGASPERVEQLVTDKIEKKVQELPELDEVSSVSRTGVSIVTVTLKDQVKPDDLAAVWDNLDGKLDDINDLPQGSVPDLNTDDVGVVYGIAIGLTGDGYSYAEMKEYADDIKDDLIKLPDAAKVELCGVQDERIFVQFDNARLKEYGLSAQKLQSIISGTNILSSGGEVNLGENRIILEPTGNFNSVDEIKNILISLGDGSQVVHLGDITNVTRGYVDPAEQLVKIDGEDAISLHISLIDGANIVQLGEEVNKVMNQWTKKMPVGLELKRLASVDYYITDKINAFVVNLIQSIVIVLAVMLLFLGIRTGFVIASLIPLVVITTLMIMGVMGMGLNQVTLAALIMALGMMVDNAIVVSETIMVKMENGMKAAQAAIEAASELFVPLLTSTLTTSAAFISFYLAESVMGDIMGPIFVVISIALLSSWILALTIITMFCVLFLKVKPKKEQKINLTGKIINKLKYAYKGLIVRALSRKVIVVCVIVLLFFVSLIGFKVIPFVFFPDSDRNLITVDINLPEGTRIEKTADVVASIEQFFVDSLKVNAQRTEGISDWSSYVGAGPESYDLGYTPDEPNDNYAHILVNTSSFEVNNLVISRVDDYCFNHFPNADIKVSSLKSGGGGTPIEIKVSGDNPDQLSAIAETIKSKLYNTPYTKNVSDDWGPKSKKFVIKIDQNRARNAGITNQDIATSLQTSLDGYNTGVYREEDKSIPIVLRSDESQQLTLNDIETMSVYSQSTGKNVPLLQVADVVPQWQYSRIRRLDLNRTIIVSCELRDGGNSNQIVSGIIPWLDQQEAEVWGEGYTYSFGGDKENTADNMGAVIKYLPLSGFIIILLLVIQFNSMRKTLMIVSTIPLGIIGVVIGLLIFGENFGFMPFLGVISLAGIVINNAIVLIDRIDVEINEQGRDVHDAVITACLQRFRPILLATTTTILGLLPLYISGGEMWSGMAVSIMIGLLFGTMITLVFIPSFYSILFKVNYKDYTFDEALMVE